MHFEPAPSTQDPSTIRDRLGKELLLDRELDSDPEPDERAPRKREGLPPGFRMRHARHYVEQLTGDAPLRTVREIALADIEAPPEEPDVDVDALERSVRQIGVLEPLLLRQHGRGYRVIAGVNRLRAARNAGLGTVPCLVHDVDEEVFDTMRQAVTHRAAAAVPAPSDLAVSPSADVPLSAALAGLSDGLSFVAALLPAIAAAGDDRLRCTTLTDLASVELTRARTVAAAASLLGSTPDLVREDASGQELIEEALGELSIETRLRGIRVHTAMPSEDYRVPLDRGLIRLALGSMLQGMCLLGAGSVRVTMTGTQVRPALIVALTQAEVPIAPDAPARFFDAGWGDHPAGPAGALLLAAAVRVARLHGGRLNVQQQPVEGCTMTFVIPRPLMSS